MDSHSQFEEDFELYEMGVLDGSEKTEFEAQLADSAELRAQRAAARGRLALLALAAPSVAPPPEVRERILESFKARNAQRLEGEQSVRPRRRSWIAAWTPVWAAICLILVVAAAWLAIDNRKLSGRLAELELTRAQLEASSRELQVATARAQAALNVLTAPETIQVDLSPTAARPVPHGKAFYNPTGGLLFYTTNLHSLPAGQTYELWLIPAQGSPVGAGVFNTDSRGNGQVILPSLPQGLTAKAFAVTIEPAGGVPAPTGPKVLVGLVS
jgi:anti-sigma-K factor RskA